VFKIIAGSMLTRVSRRVKITSRVGPNLRRPAWGWNLSWNCQRSETALNTALCSAAGGEVGVGRLAGSGADDSHIGGARLSRRLKAARRQTAGSVVRTSRTPSSRGATPAPLLPASLALSSALYAPLATSRPARRRRLASSFRPPTCGFSNGGCPYSA
jgi:hypothetical protein